MYATLEEIQGHIFEKVESDYMDHITFYRKDGKALTFYHSQDCCESVYIEDINGILSDLVETPILLAEERTEYNETAYGDECWTFYTFRTIKGSVDVRWYGSSNGYYSTSVSLRMS